MYILGISAYYHDSSAALLKDGKIVAAAEQERFSRIKHDNTFPIDAIRFCLASEKITAEDLEYVAFYEKPLLKFERVLSQHVFSFPRSLKTFLSSMPSWINEKLRVPRTVRKKLGYKKAILFIDHHLAHAASTFLVSPYNRAAIVTVDGVGEWSTATVGIGKGTEIRILSEIRFPHSVGLLYSTITAYLGFSVNNSEYKVMGLSPYGDMNRKTNKYYPRLKKVIRIAPDGSFSLNMDYFVFHYKDRMPSERLCELLGGPISKRDSDMTQRHKDIAAALQMVTEDALQGMLRYAHGLTKEDNIVLSGGVALNSVFNGKILKTTPFKGVWIQPNASDGGTSIGAASYVYNSLLGNPRDYVMSHAYLGPEFTDKDIQNFLDNANIKHSVFRSREELLAAVAQLLIGNNVVGWFQGRMEWGPRALGNRSILANACNRDMQNILNLKVKHREKFRPFAPVVCEDDADTYFVCDKPVPDPTDFMLMVYPIRKKWHRKIPAVTHVDGSGRLQTVRRQQNELYYDLIKGFGKLSGIPILVNTSFNIRGEPIVCTPKDAYRCMMGTGIDCIVMGNYLIKRQDNPKDMWNSEKNAKD